MTKDLSKYLGRTFVFGVTDCYTLTRDFYKNEFDIELTDYARYDGWWNDGLNLYADNIRKEGFFLLQQGEELRYGDLILMCLSAPVPSHAAIYVGNNKVLHHVQNRLSRIDDYRGMFRNFTASIWRHEKLKDKVPERKEYEIIKKAEERDTISL